MRFFGKKPKQLSAKEQEKLDLRLEYAVNWGDTKKVRWLLATGANVHTDNNAPLRTAVHNGHTEMVKVLLANGADLHADDDWALCLAGEQGHTETVRALLAAGASVHMRDGHALRGAVINGHMEIVRILAKHAFAPDLWRGKGCSEIEIHATELCNKIKPSTITTKSKRLWEAEARTILTDYAIRCWHKVRLAPPKLQISPLPAQPKPL